MEENFDVSKELQHKNQEMLLNKKKIDLDNSMESLVLFYSNYSTNIASEINTRVCSLRGISQDSEQSMIFYNTITSFFFLASKKLKEIIASVIIPLKEKLDTINDENYSDVLNHTYLVITNKMYDYYTESINMLSNELNQDVNEEIKNKINSYVFDVITVKMMNTLRDKFMYGIKVINNNNEENKEVMETINEKTIK